jgi:hypothetical protein
MQGIVVPPAADLVRRRVNVIVAPASTPAGGKGRDLNDPIRSPKSESLGADMRRREFIANTIGIMGANKIKELL